MFTLFFSCNSIFCLSSSFQYTEEEPVEFIEDDLDYAEWERHAKISTTLNSCSQSEDSYQIEWLDDSMSTREHHLSIAKSVDDPTTDHSPRCNRSLTIEPWLSDSSIVNVFSTDNPEIIPSTSAHQRQPTRNGTAELQIDNLSDDFKTSMHQTLSTGNLQVDHDFSTRIPPLSDTQYHANDLHFKGAPNSTYTLRTHSNKNDSPILSSNPLHSGSRPEEENHVQLNNSADPATSDTRLISLLDFSSVTHSESYKTQVKVQGALIKSMKEKLKHVKRKLFVSQQAGQRRLKSALKAKKENKILKKELKSARKQRSENEVLGAQARKNPVIFDFLKNSTRKPKGRRYNASTMKFAAGTYLSGPRAYRYVRNSKHITLPHKSSVYKHNKHVRIQPGINSSLLSAVKRKVREIKHKKNKIVTITCDGMSIKKDLAYSAKADIFHGFPDDGIRRRIEKNDPSVLATEAVVVMASGMYMNFKQVS